MFELHPHPDFPGNAVRAISVAAQRTARGLMLRYEVTGALTEVLWPAPAEAERTDGLWRHSCFEAFVRTGGEPSYREINLSPSGRWATYVFQDYRAGMREDEGRAEAIAWAPASKRAELAASVLLTARGDWRLGLSAVIEERSGAKSFWALNHPAGAPDFHHPDCFAAHLAAPDVA